MAVCAWSGFMGVEEITFGGSGAGGGGAGVGGSIQYFGIGTLSGT